MLKLMFITIIIAIAMGWLEGSLQVDCMCARVQKHTPTYRRGHAREKVGQLFDHEVESRADAS